MMSFIGSGSICIIQNCQNPDLIYLFEIVLILFLFLSMPKDYFGCNPNSMYFTDDYLNPI